MSGVSPFTGDRAESIEMIRDSARGLLGSDMARVRKLRFTEPGFDPALLRQMGEAGWIGLAVPEDAGGTGLGQAEMVALAEEIGRASAPEPLIGCSLSAHLLAATGETELLGQLLAGDAVVLTAWQDRANTLDLAGSTDGARGFVLGAAGATHVLWPVAENGRVALHVLERAQVEITTEATQDGGHVGTIRPLAYTGHGPGRHVADDIGAALTEGLDRASLATAAALLGGMEAAFAMTLDYLRTRQQFGKIIGTFQALQHKAADAKMQIALTRAAVEEAAAALDDGGPSHLVSRAKARASEAAMLVQQACVQLHGGIGYTDDYDVGLHMRRAMVLVPAFGGAALHRRRFMELSPELEDA
jgi:alkylation response protein AidB-like acyl-CoA dehydrogenase